MSVLLFLITAFIPGFLWLWYFYRKDEYEPEPIRMVAFIFFLGMLTVIPAGILEVYIQPYLTTFADEGTTLYHFLDTFFIVGPVEEFLKFYVVFKFAYQHHEFDEPLDGIIYGSAAALGFASLENLVYMLTHGWAVIILRGVLSTLGHVLFASFWGFALGLARFETPDRRAFIILMGLLAAIGTHALYDFVLFAFPGLAIFLIIPLMVAMWKMAHKQIDHALARSPHQPVRFVTQQLDEDNLNL